MSEFTNTKQERIQILNLYMVGIIEGKNGAKLVKDLGLKETSFLPTDVIAVFDLLFDAKFEVSKLKPASNKLFNILYESLKAYPQIKPEKNSFIGYFQKDNAQIKQILKKLNPLIQSINHEIREESLAELHKQFNELQKTGLHYTAKENILFPQLEAHWKDHDCLKLMWSFHDDIRQNLKQILALINSTNFDLKKFNKLAGLLFFNISTIIFREERILFPTMTETLNPALMDKMLIELAEMKLPFIKIKNPVYKIKKEVDNFNERIINFSSGKISIEQIELIFNYLPVDITFVDENETVCFFSSPKHRIFPRSASIIGREVQNCHPPESVDVVNRIIKSFKSGEKEKAHFWLKLGEKFVLIQYFAVRDTNQNYRGVLEVSQEISEIQRLSGEKKLLDW